MKDIIFREEQLHLDKTYTDLESEISMLRDETAPPKSIQVSYLTNRDEIPFMIEERNRHDATTVHIRQKIEEYNRILKEVYFARIDIDYVTYSKTYYISKTGLSFLGTTDWRSDIGALMYDTTTSEYNGKFHINFKRRFTIRDKNLLDYKEIIVRDSEVSNVTDEFLIKVLNEKKGDKRVTDIIKSIQLEQNDIIRLNPKYNITVLGCAGSGKTMILFHRLSYLSFHERIKWNKVKIITPNDDFGELFKALKSDLGLTQIKMMTLTDYFKEKLGYFGIRDLNERLLDEYDIKDEILRKIYSLETQSALFKFYSQDLDKLTNLLSTSNNHRFYSTEYNEPLDQYNHFKNIKYRLVSDSESRLEGIEEKINDSKANVYGAIKLFLESLVVANSYNVVTENLCESNDISFDSSNRIQLTDVLTLCKDLSLNIYDSSEVNSISNSTFTKVELKKLIQFLEVSISKYTSACSQLEKINEKILSGDRQSKKLNQILLINVTKINELNADRDATKFYQFVLRSQIDNKLQSLTSQNSTLKVQIKELEKLIISLNQEMTDVRNSLNQIVVGTTFDDNVLNEYSKVVSLLKKAQKEYSSVKSYIELVKNKENMLNVIKKIDFVTNLRLWFDNRFIKKYISEIMNNGDLKMNQNKFTYHFYYYYLLLLICTFESSERLEYNADQMICIDEFQDVSINEIQLLKEINNNKVTLNLYGDFNQRMLSKGVLSTKDIPKDHHNYKLNNNYRNTNQITQFYNRELDKNDNPVGINGPNIEMINLSKIKEIYSEKFNSAIICHRSQKTYLSRVCPNCKILGVEESKGLEFNTVYVYSKSMNDNERYISYSRSLYKLYIVE